MEIARRLAVRAATQERVPCDLSRLIAALGFGEFAVWRAGISV